MTDDTDTDTDTDDEESREKHGIVGGSDFVEGLKEAFDDGEDDDDE